MYSGLTPVWWTGEYYRSSDLMWILLVLASTFVCAPCGARTLVPAHSSDTPAGAGPVKIGRRADVSIRRDISRPHLEGPERSERQVHFAIKLVGQHTANDVHAITRLVWSLDGWAAGFFPFDANSRIRIAVEQPIPADGNTALTGGKRRVLPRWSSTHGGPSTYATSPRLLLQARS